MSAGAPRSTSPAPARAAEAKEAAPPAATGEKPIKPAMKPADLFPSIGFNMFFTTGALIDYSIFVWGNEVSDGSRLHFLAQYQAWGSGPPILGLLKLLILPILPFVIFNFFKEGLSSVLGWARAKPWRHAADIGQCVCINFLILPIVFTKCLPMGGHIAAVCVPGEKGVIGPECQEAVNGFQPILGWMVLLNLFMFACDIVRYNVGALPDAAAEAKKAE